jgi:hypothetical protein
MIERWIQAVRVEDPGREDAAATRARLRSLFPAGATRRMTQLGLFLGSVLSGLPLGPEDDLVYATAYGESQALREYLDGFPTPSPTLFQTSIHPSAPQQVRVPRQGPVREFFPFAGRRQSIAHAAQAALLSSAPRVVLCGGEERNDWLADSDAASPESFAFALELVRESAGALGRLALEPGGSDPGALTLPEFFAALRERRLLNHPAAAGWRLLLEWS